MINKKIPLISEGVYRRNIRRVLELVQVNIQFVKESF